MLDALSAVKTTSSWKLQNVVHMLKSGLSLCLPGSNGSLAHSLAIHNSNQKVEIGLSGGVSKCSSAAHRRANGIFKELILYHFFVFCTLAESNLSCSLKLLYRRISRESLPRLESNGMWSLIEIITVCFIEEYLKNQHFGTIDMKQECICRKWWTWWWRVGCLKSGFHFSIIKSSTINKSTYPSLWSYDTMRTSLHVKPSALFTFWPYVC